MKISIHNYLTEQQETITIPDRDKFTDIEIELSKLGYSLSNIDYMVLKDDVVTLANVQRNNL